MKATPVKWPLLTESGNRRISPGEWGIVVENSPCSMKDCADQHTRIKVRFDDGEEVWALEGYWSLES